MKMLEMSNAEFAGVYKPEGEIDVLIGLDYAAYHPQMISSHKNYFPIVLGHV